MHAFVLMAFVHLIKQSQDETPLAKKNVSKFQGLKLTI
jgi:hypothetical protein